MTSRTYTTSYEGLVGRGQAKEGMCLVVHHNFPLRNDQATGCSSMLAQEASVSPQARSPKVPSSHPPSV